MDLRLKDLSSRHSLIPTKLMQIVVSSYLYILTTFGNLEEFGVATNLGMRRM